MLSHLKPLIVGLLVFLGGCLNKPYVRSEFGSAFGVGSGGYFPAEKLTTADAQVREKLVVITGDKNAECVVRFDDFSVMVTTFTRHPLSPEQVEQVERHAWQVKQQHWISPPPRRMN